MTKNEAKERFVSEVLGYVVAKYGHDDEVAINEAWNDWTDMLAKEGEISMRQYDTWDTPRFTDRDKLDALAQAR